METRAFSVNSSKKWRILSLAFFIVLVILAMFFLPWKETWQALRHAKLNFIIVAFSLSIPLQFFMAFTYKLILDSQGAFINYWRIFLINMGLSFYDIVLPSTFIVSGMRWFRYSQQSQKPAQSLVSIAFYKVFNVVLALTLSLAFLIFTDVTSLQGHIWQIAIVLAGIVFFMLATPWICRGLVERLPNPTLESQSRRIFDKIRQYIYKAIQAFAEFEQLQVTTQLVIIVLGITNHLIMYTCYLLFARSVGVNLTYAQLGTLRAILVLAMNLPFNFGIGVNLRDVTLLAVLTAMGIALDKAVAISVISFGRYLFTGILGGFAELLNILIAKKVKTSVPLDNRSVDV